MSSLSERDTVFLHHNAEIKDGQKFFGSNDSIIETSTYTQEIEVEKQKPKILMVIPVMERHRKFLTTFNRILNTVSQSGIPTQIVVMDNSLEKGLIGNIQTAMLKQPFEAVTSLIYHHDPRMIQSTARNTAVQELSKEGEVVALWDSDIYCSVNTLADLINTWDRNPYLLGIAPPLGTHDGDNISQSISKYSKWDEQAKFALQMPGEIGLKIGKENGEILETAIMRGAFLLQRSLIDYVASQNPDQKPWLADFVVWQNIPFFLSVKEADFSVGYAMSANTVVVHDSRPDNFSVGNSLPYRTIETLKSIFIIMSRNQVFTEQGMTINNRFLRFNIAEITRVTGYTSEKASELQNTMLKLAEVFFNSDNYANFVLDTSVLIARLDDDDVGYLIKGIVGKVDTEDIFKRLKKITGNSSRPIYIV